MKSNLPKILIGVLLFLVATLIIGAFSLWNERTDLIETVATEKQKVKDRDDKLAEFDIKLADFENSLNIKKDSISGLKRQIVDGKLLIISIQKDRDEKLKIIERFTVSDMQQFFDKRYGTGK